MWLRWCRLVLVAIPCVELLLTGYEVVVVDNFDNSKPEAIHRIEELPINQFHFYEADVRDEETLRGILRKNTLTL